MKRILSITLLAFMVLCATASAAGITIMSAQKEYFVRVGDKAEIPLTISSTYSGPVDGMLETATTELLQKPGMMMTRSVSRSFYHTIQPGDTTLTASGGTSNTAKTIKVRISFDYMDKVPMQAALPEFVIYFVENESQARNVPGPLTGSGVPGGPGVGEPSASSIQLVQETVPDTIRQIYQDSSPGQALQNSQLQENTGTLREQVQGTAGVQDNFRDAFLENLTRDSLMQEITGTLAADGFSRQRIDPIPESPGSGTFSAVFGRETGNVSVMGLMKDGSIEFVTEVTAAPVSIIPAIAANDSFRTYQNQLGAEGFRSSLMVINRTTSRSSVNLTFMDAQGHRAWIAADEYGGIALRVSLVRDQGTVSALFLIAGAVIAGIAAAGSLLYRMKRKNAHPGAPHDIPASGSVPAATDYGSRAERLLLEAEKAASERRHKDACGYAGRALRHIISGRYGDGSEISGAEAVRILQKGGIVLPGAEEILTSCDIVGFARGSTDERSIRGMIGTIRSILQEDKRTA